MNSKVVENERKDGSSSILTFSRDVEVGGGAGWGGAFSRRHEITAIVIVI